MKEEVMMEKGEEVVGKVCVKKQNRLYVCGVSTLKLAVIAAIFSSRRNPSIPKHSMKYFNCQGIEASLKHKMLHHKVFSGP